MHRASDRSRHAGNTGELPCLHLHLDYYRFLLLNIINENYLGLDDKHERDRRQPGVSYMRENEIPIPEWLRLVRCGLPQLLQARGHHPSIAQKQKKRHKAFERQMTCRLGFEPLEQRALLSADLQFHHIIFNPTAGAASVQTGASGAVAAKVAQVGSSLPPSSRFYSIANSNRIRNQLDQRERGRPDDCHRGRLPTIPTSSTTCSSLTSNLVYLTRLASSILNQNGGTDLSQVPTDTTGGWESEEALDVEWAHAIAPGANIVLIEANSPSTANLLTAAVNTARSLSGVSVVSMSFGRSEYSSETALDSLFTSLSGHPVTFVASTGDSGSPGNYPAFSPNVVAVGGTSLYLSGNNYSSETAWSGSGGGQSSYESEPSYQSSVQSSGKRQIPDVSFDADPNTGVAIYDSYNGGSSDPWYQIGGTSLSSPCWAGLIAIADQLRAGQGLAALDGATQTLPKLYSLLAADFHKITNGSYDDITGLGTPIANKLVPDLALPPVPDMTVAKTHTGNFHPGDVGDTYTITVTNSGAAATSGTVSVVDTLPSGLTRHGPERFGLDRQSHNVNGESQRRAGRGRQLPGFDADGKRGRQRSGQRHQRGDRFRRRRDIHSQRHGQRSDDHRPAARPDHQQDPLRQFQAGRRRRHLFDYSNQFRFGSKQRHCERG